MDLSPKTQAVMLLTAHFSKPRSNDAKPLTPSEWGKFADWLRDEDLRPEMLLFGDISDKLAGWLDKKITVDRIEKLLDRGSALGIATEKWLRSGLWVVVRSDKDYPRLLKKRLGTVSPPIFFGCGNASLLNQRCIAIVGSRNASNDDLAYAAQLGVSAAEAGVSVVSGGAKGVDESAMLGALRVDGTAIGILANSLSRACASQKYRTYLSSNNLVLVSPYYPEAGFDIGNAMGRNKYIYCLSEAAVVVHSGESGGTLNGSFENLKKGWVPLWVKPTPDSAAGNSNIVDQGGIWTVEDPQEISVSRLLSKSEERQFPVNDGDLLTIAEGAAGTYKKRELPDVVARSDYHAEEKSKPMEPEAGATPADLISYELFLEKIKEACEERSLSIDELENHFGVKKNLFSEWLKKAVADKQVRKLTKPVQYQWLGGDPQQRMFPDEC